MPGDQGQTDLQTTQAKQEQAQVAGSCLSFGRRFWGHLTLVLRHKVLVFRYCRKSGLWRQGLCHDLSKFSPAEFLPSVRHFQGYRSPADQEREQQGYSFLSIHHVGRNPHHLEFWMDYSLKSKCYGPVPMPLPYVCESVCDRLAASKIYLKEKYSPQKVLAYYEGSRQRTPVHPETDALFLHYLKYLVEEGEERLFLKMREDLRKNS